MLSICRLGVVAVAVLLAVSPVFPQEPVMQLAPEELAPHQRPPVTFKHELHATNIECLRCHHDFDQFGFNIGGEGLPCAECHTREPGANPIGLMEAYHQMCKGCHQSVQDQYEETPPVLCGQCHVKP